MVSERLQKYLTIKLTTKEILFLSALLGFEDFIGIDNPLVSLTYEELVTEWNNVQKSLELKKYIDASFNGTITIDKIVHDIIYTCCNSEIYICVNCSECKINLQEHHYYITEKLAVEMYLETLKCDEYVFNILLGQSELINQIINITKIQKAELNQLEGKIRKKIRISESVLNTFKNLLDINNISKAKEFLVTENFEEQTIQKLISLIKSPEKFISIVIINFNNSTNEQLDELVFIQDIENITKFSPVTENNEFKYDFIPTSSQEITNIIDSAIKDATIIYNPDFSFINEYYKFDINTKNLCGGY